MKKLISKTFILLVIITLTLTMFSACGNSIGKETPVKDSADNQTEKNDYTKESSELDEKNEVADLVLWTYPFFIPEGKKHGDFEKEIIKEFQKDYPNVKVNIETIAWDGGPEKVNVAIATKSAPDILIDAYMRIMEYGMKGHLVSFNDVMTEEDKNDIYPKVLEQCTFDGKIYQYPWTSAAVVMAVNKELFKKADAEDLLPLDRPNREWTIEEFEKALDAVSKLDGVYGLTCYAGNEMGDASIRMFIQNFGADVVNSDYTKVLINDDSGYKGMEWLVNAYKKGWIIKGAESLTSSDIFDIWFQGKAAITFLGSSWMPDRIESMKKEGTVSKDFEVVFVNMPHAEGVSTKVEGQTSGVCVFDNDDNQKALISKKLSIFMAKNYHDEGNLLLGRAPVRKSSAVKYENAELRWLSGTIQNLADTGALAPGYSEIRKKWFPEFQAALTGFKTPKEALDSFAKEAQKVLDEHNNK
ncbi:extracellular solute-binding protein [Candidatus Parcubacteria bacterium]|nr:MAG: extracellular solute-binding protein [Candidatus Parcubacteria bacterium]